MEGRLLMLLAGIWLSPTLAGTSAVDSRKRKEWAKVKYTTLTLPVVSPSHFLIRSLNNLDPEGSWRRGVRSKNPGRRQRQRNRVQVDENTCRPGVRCCTVLTSCQRSSARWFSAWLRGHWALRALLAVRAELYASLDTVTIVKNTANVHLWHSVRFCS